MTTNPMRPSLSATLAFINAKLDRLRFAGTDQNPHGIRDMLGSCVLEAERMEKADDAVGRDSLHDEMLVALKDSEARLEEVIEDDPDASMFAETLASLRAIIAKAEGRSK